MKLKFFIVPVALVLVGAGCSNGQRDLLRRDEAPIAQQTAPSVIPEAQVVPVPVPAPAKIGLGLAGSFLLPPGLVVVLDSYSSTDAKNYYESGVSVYPEKTYETLLGAFEGDTPPPFVTFSVVGNPEAYDALKWAQKNDKMSSYSLLVGKVEPAPEVKSNLGIPVVGIRYETDDMYGARVSVYITPNKDRAIMITENYSGSDDAATQMLFQKLLQSLVVRGIK
ncbi:MAG: hypothetical protein NT003_04375 [Candidatus Magasanikbacteria bacterium]|nr:hypothetical protein [Candidatus Magasanikbacteria bacterium]